MKKKFLWLLLTTVTLSGVCVSAQEQYTEDAKLMKISLPLDGTMQVPATWKAMTGEEYVRTVYGGANIISLEKMNALTEAIWAAYGKFDANGQLLAWVVIERLQNTTITQKDIRSASSEFIAEFDIAAKEMFVGRLEAFGAKMQNWKSHQKVYIDGWAVLQNSKQYVADEVVVTESVLRVTARKNSFLILISFIEQNYLEQYSQIDQMIESVHLGPVATVADIDQYGKSTWFSTLSQSQQILYGSFYYIVGALVGSIPASFFRRSARSQFNRLSALALGMLCGIFAIILAEIALPYTLSHTLLFAAVLGGSYVVLRKSD